MRTRKSKTLLSPKDKILRSSKHLLTQSKELIKIQPDLGAGWTTTNILYLKTISKENMNEEIYKIFGIPPEFKNDSIHYISNIFIDFQLESFLFSQQFNDTTKELIVLMILNDYICNIPTCKNPKFYINQFHTKVIKIISNNESFNPNEIHLLSTYIKQNLESNIILQFVFTDQTLQEVDKECFAIMNKYSSKSEADNDNNEEISQQTKLEEQLNLMEDKEKKMNEAKEKELEMGKTIEAAIEEKFNVMRTEIEHRNDALVRQIKTMEDMLDGNRKGRKKSIIE